jgi:heptosyltransferase-2
LRAVGAATIVALAPGCRHSVKRWPAERFAAVGKFLDGHGIGVVLLGGASESRECEQIARIIGPNALSLAGRLSLPEAMEVLRRSRLTVCVDSGLQHVASAVGTPTVSLFSFWDMRGKWVPHGGRNIVLQRWVPCHTCFLDECPHDNRCMKAIETAEVIGQVAAKLGLPGCA